MNRRSSVLSVLGALFLTACAPTRDKADDARVLREGEVAAFVKDWGGKDGERIASHYADDGSFSVPNVPTMTGRAAIANGMKGTLADPNWLLALNPVQVEVSTGSDLGYVRGTYMLTASDLASKKVATEKGRFVTIFRKQADGTWKAIQHFSNAEATATLN